MMSDLDSLNPMVFVRDESDPDFRSHMIARAQEAMYPANRLPLSALKERLGSIRYDRHE